MRTVVLHYHLFKNAGTSVDRVLQRAFGPGWVTKEFGMNRRDNGAEVARWIRETPAAAFSSHTMMGPLPEIEGVRVIRVMFLRDPAARIASAYRFERAQGADTFGSVLARHTDLQGYVRCRLALSYDRQCRNFQTERLASLNPGPAPEVERAAAAMDAIEVLGLVEAFDQGLGRLQSVLADHFAGFVAEPVHANRSERAGQGLPDAETLALIRAANLDDLALIDRLRVRLALSASDASGRAACA